MRKLWQDTTALLLALVFAGAALGIPAWAARREERALLSAARPRPEFGGILWQEPVRQNPVLYALHRNALQGGAPPSFYGYAGQDADPAAAAAEAAPLLKTLHEAGVAGDVLMTALEPLLAAPAAAWRSTGGGRFTGLRLSLPGDDTRLGTSLDLAWHTESGLPVALTANVPGTDFNGLDLQATAQAWRSLLGLDALGDWTEDNSSEGCLVCTSAVGQVRLTVRVGSGYMDLELAAES